MKGFQLENIDSVTISNTQWGYVGGMDQAVQSNSNVNFNNLVIGDLTVSGTRTELNVLNLNVEDKYILLNSGSNSATQVSSLVVQVEQQQGKGTYLGLFLQY